MKSQHKFTVVFFVVFLLSILIGDFSPFVKAEINIEDPLKMFEQDIKKYVETLKYKDLEQMLESWEGSTVEYEDVKKLYISYIKEQEKISSSQAKDSQQKNTLEFDEDYLRSNLNKIIKSAKNIAINNAVLTVINKEGTPSFPPSSVGEEEETQEEETQTQQEETTEGEEEETQEEETQTQQEETTEEEEEETQEGETPAPQEETNEEGGSTDTTDSQSFDEEFQKDGYTYEISIRDLPSEITVDGTTYEVVEVSDYEIDDFGNVVEIKVKVKDMTGNEKEIALNKEVIKEKGIKAQVSAKLYWQDRVKMYATTFRALSAASDYFEEVIPQLKEIKENARRSLGPVIDTLNWVADIPSSVCREVFSWDLGSTEPGTKVVSRGGSSSLFLDAKKQLVKTEDGEEVYYYRYSFGIDPNAILEPSVISTGGSVKISVFAKTTSGLTIYLNLDDDENREEYITIYEPYFYSNGLYSKTKKLSKLCMRYLGSLSDLNEDGQRFLRNDFCVDFHAIETE